MANFEINGNEYELKLTWESVKYLNKKIEGGSMGLVGQALMGDLDIFADIVHAGLFHTGEKFTLVKVEKQIEALFAEGKLDAIGIMRLSNEVISESFFYKPLITKLLADSPEAQQQMTKLLS